MGSINLSALVRHLSDSVKHITAAERTAWNGKAAGSHTHTRSQITDFPTSLPANGGNADTLNGYHASNFLRNSMTVALSDNFTTERVVGNDSSLPLYREYIRQTADGTTVNKIFRLFSPSGKYSDLSIQCKNDVFTWGFAGTGTTDVTLNGKSVLTSGAAIGYVSGTVSYSKNDGSEMKVNIGFKPSVLLCVGNKQPAISNTFNVPARNMSVLLVDDSSYELESYTSGAQYGNSSDTLIITKTATGFNVKSESARNATTPFNYLAFE